MKLNKLLSVAYIGIAIIGSSSVVNAANAEFSGYTLSKAQIKGTQYQKERDAARAELAALRATAAGPVAPGEFGVLATCVVTGNNVPYIELAKAKIKEILANDAPGAVIPASADKAVLIGQLNAFIDTLNSNAALGLTPNAPAPGNDNAHLVSARKAAIDTAMVQKVNEEMDRLAVADAPQIKDALMAVFAGR